MSRIKSDLLKTGAEIIFGFLIWNFLLSYFIGNTGQAILFMMIEFQSVNAEGSADILAASLIIDLFCFGVITFIWVKIIIPTTFALKKELNGDYEKQGHLTENLKSFQVLIKDYKIKRSSEVLFITILTFRGVLFNLILTGFSMVPRLQVSFFIILSITMLFYYIRINPCRHLIKTIEYCFYEVITLLTNAFVLKIAVIDDSNSETSIALGNGLLVLDMIMLIGSLVFTVIELGILIY